MLRKKSKGFTLIELMIVVAIIAILAAIAIPQFMKFQAKSKQSEARTILSGIYTAEETYFAEKNDYNASMDVIGFEPASALKYYEEIEIISVSSNGFTATTSGNIDKDSDRDVWYGCEDDREPYNFFNDVNNTDNTAGWADVKIYD